MPGLAKLALIIFVSSVGLFVYRSCAPEPSPKERADSLRGMLKGLEQQIDEQCSRGVLDYSTCGAFRDSLEVVVESLESQEED